jgi:lipopolysaccharide transport system ATP-binding protein
MSQSVISLQAIEKTYRIFSRPQDRLKQMLLGSKRRHYFKPFPALCGVDLEVTPGQTVGIIGRNGSGKSTLLQIICGTLAATGGQMTVKGRIAALLELGAGFNPEFSGRDNILLNGAILGFSEAQMAQRYESIVAFSGLSEEQIARPVKTYSSGMYVRLAFSVAIAVEPEILVIDEALAVGDEAFQRKCFDRIKQLQAQGMTILFVSHSPQSVIELCDHAVLLDAGEKLCEGEPKDVITAYQRLLYAPADQQPAIRDALKQGIFQALQAEKAEDQADAAVVNESRLEYPPSGGRIHAPRLLAENGEAVSVLETGKRYRFVYEVQFDEAASGCQFGMLVKSKRGINLSGVVNKQWAAQECRVEAGERVQVSFDFECRLLPEHYFLNCGVMRHVDGEDHFIHRIIDALEFKVIDAAAPADQGRVGHVDLAVTAQVQSVDKARAG